MGTGELWQDKIINELKDLQVLILNPRRNSWDSTWKQDDSEPNFVEQVTWELEGQERATHPVYYFAGDSKSPITLLELGLFKDKSPIVYCPRKFYRFGNIQIVCRRYGIEHYENELDWINSLKARLA